MTGMDDAWPKAIGAITLFVEDLAAAKEFYGTSSACRSCSRMPTRRSSGSGPRSSTCSQPAQRRELIEPGAVAPRDAGSRFQLTIEVDDVDALCAELTRRGVTLLNGPVDRPWGVRTASFVDPGGHIWEIAK